MSLSGESVSIVALVFIVVIVEGSNGRFDEGWEGNDLVVAVG